MADNVTERRIRPIQDAANAGNLKQALKECEKWLKKGERSDRFLALKALVLVQQTDQDLVEQGESEIIDLCYRTPPVTDLEAIKTVQDALRESSLDPVEGEELYARAAAANPSDRVLLMTWLEDCVEDARWQGAQKATMALRKAFPNERDYDFWNILLCFLVHRDSSVEEKQRTMFGMLAYRMISKVSPDPSVAQDQSHPSGRVVSTSEELALLARIYVATGYAKEAIQLLSQLLFNEAVNVGSHDPQLTLSLLLDAIAASEDWTQAVDICDKLLDNPEYRNDDRIWDVILKVHHLGDDSARQAAARIVETNTADDSLRSRASAIAKLRSVSRADALDQDEIAKLCQTYHATYKSRSFAFQDIRPTLELLDSKRAQMFSDHLDGDDDSATSPVEQLFRVKSKRVFSSSAAVDHLNHAAEAMRISQQSSDQPSVAAEALLLAALSILNAAFQSQSHKLLLQATILLQLSYARDESHFPTAVLLVTLYRYLGLFSLAISTFASLSVKNLQFETVAHHLFTRISTLHPDTPSTSHADADSNGPRLIMDPAFVIETILMVNAKVAKGLADSIKRGLRHGSYLNILDAVDTRASIKASLGKKLAEIEALKIGRVFGDDRTNDTGDDLIWVLPEQLSDMRDFAFLPAYSTPDVRLWDHLSCGPLPKHHWLDTMLFSENLRAYFMQDERPSGQGDWHAVNAAREAASRTASHDTDELTPQERRSYELSQSIYEVANAYQQSPSDSSAAPPTTTEQARISIEAILTGWLETSTSESDHLLCNKNTIIGVPWTHLHTYYTAFEAASLVMTYVRWANNAVAPRSGPKKGKANKSKAGKLFPSSGIATNLKTAAHELNKKVLEQAVKQKAELSQGGVLGKLVDTIMETNEPNEENDTMTKHEEFSSALKTTIEQHLGGEAAVETCVGKWLASWEDALEGVLMVDVPSMPGVVGARQTGGVKAAAGALLGGRGKGKDTGGKGR